MNHLSKFIYLPLLVLNLSFADAAVFTVKAGDAADFVNVLSKVSSYDTVIVPPGSYAINADLKDMMSWGTDLYIRGNGLTPGKTKLIGLTLTEYNGYLVMDNVAIYGTNSTSSATIEEDEDNGIIFRSSAIYTNNNADHGIQIWSQRIGFINTNIINQVSYPSSSSHAYNDEGDGLVMLNSKISGYDKALDLDSYYWSDNARRDYKIYNTDLSSNNIACHVCTSYDACTDSVTNCPTLLALTPNTPANQKYTVTNFIDILRFKKSYSGDGPYIPVSIYFLKVKTAGETTVYRLPSAYPYPPVGWNSATGDVQYYQFDSTAVLNNAAATVYFNKTVVDAQFPGGSTIKCFTYANLGWVSLTATVTGGNYAITFPSTSSVTGLLAFLYQ